jgi:integrase/recombinase XerD
MPSKLVPAHQRTLTTTQFADIADVPPEIEWLANLTNAKTRHAYKRDVSEFSNFSGLTEPTQLRTVTRAHVIAWRKDMEARALSAASVRRKLSALSSLFDYLCERNAVLVNPVDGVKRPIDGEQQRRQHSGTGRCAGSSMPRLGRR